jgi:predicted HTH domain antitoxin
MTDLVLKIPHDVPVLLKSEADFDYEAKVFLAVKLLELGKLTSGKAAELAEMPRAAFLYTLARYYVSATNLHAEKIEHEVEAAKRIVP